LNAMNIDPPIDFDPDEELARFGDSDQKLYGLPERIYFYLIETCRSVAVFAGPAFTIDSVFGPPGLTPAGAFVEFVAYQAFWIDVSPTRVKIWTSSGDDADARNRYLIHDGDVCDPKAWEGALNAICRVEKVGFLTFHADRMRQRWSAWLVEQKRRGDERGW
jgi:hypothetical protein